MSRFVILRTVNCIPHTYLQILVLALLKEISKEINDGKSKNKSSNGIFGVKRDLVRLIGNLCYGNKTNQDLVRLIFIVLLMILTIPLRLHSH